MSEHDPFCKAYYPDLLEIERCAWCSVIKRVRKDEQEKLDVDYWLAYNKGYIDGYDDCENEQRGYEQLAMDWEYPERLRLVSTNEDNEQMYTNGDNDATNNG